MKHLILLVLLSINALAWANQGHWIDRNPDALQLASVSAAVVDLENGVTLYSKHAELELPIASLTKVMTAMVILDAGQPLDEAITFTNEDRDSIHRSYSRIRVDSRISRKETIRLALMSSENLAAAALGNNYPGGFDAFIKAMNKKAFELGMFHSHFVDASGLSPENHASVADLTQVLLNINKYPLITELSTTVVHTAYFKGPRYKLGYTNTNGLVRIGKWPIQFSKTGYLDIAGRCLMMITEVDGRPIGIALLDSYGKKTPLGDANRIKKWLLTGKTNSIKDSARHYQKQKLNSLAKSQQVSTANL